MTSRTVDTHQKALEINLDYSKYGAIAEIGAGQETARWFFQVGGAAGTIAKAISAYDMKVSDSIYGASSRYVSRDRLQAMLGHEFNLVIDRLAEHHGAETSFFAFANTVAARSFSRNQDGHGWLGIRFQDQPHAQPSQIDLHVHLLGKENLEDQDTLGRLGVNLIYGAIYFPDNPKLLLASLFDSLSSTQLEVDMIDFTGPAFTDVDNRLMTLWLVQHGLTHAAMFDASGKVMNGSDALYKKAVLIERSRFRPPTKLTVELLDCAQVEFGKSPDVEPQDILVLSEMTLHNLVDGGDIDVEDFLHRIEILGALGKSVIITNYGEYYRLAAYLFRYTQRPIALAMGVPTLREIFNDKYYADLGGGILESFGRLFKNELRFYVAPYIDTESGSTISAENFQVQPHLRHLYAYLLDNRFIIPLDGIKQEYLSIHSHDVLDKIKRGEAGWETMVPDIVEKMIKDQRLFGCTG